MDRVQILNKINIVEFWTSERKFEHEFVSDDSRAPCQFIEQRIVCCKLEWLVRHRFPLTEDAFLACDLSCRFF